jgi:hypothetical protein
MPAAGPVLLLENFRRDEGRPNLSALDPPDVGPLAAKEFGTQLVGINGGARAGQVVDGRCCAAWASKLGDLLLEQSTVSSFS